MQKALGVFLSLAFLLFPTILFANESSQTDIGKYKTKVSVSTGGMGAKGESWVIVEKDAGQTTHYQYNYKITNTGSKTIMVRWQFIDLAVEISEVTSQNGDFIAVNPVFMQLEPGELRTFSFLSSSAPAMEKNETWPKFVSCPAWVFTYDNSRNIWEPKGAFGFDGFMPEDWYAKMELLDDYVCNFHPDYKWYRP